MGVLKKFYENLNIAFLGKESHKWLKPRVKFIHLSNKNLYSAPKKM